MGERGGESREEGFHCVPTPPSLPLAPVAMASLPTYLPTYSYSPSLLPESHISSISSREMTVLSLPLHLPSHNCSSSREHADPSLTPSPSTHTPPIAAAAAAGICAAAGINPGREQWWRRELVWRQRWDIARSHVRQIGGAEHAGKFLPVTLNPNAHDPKPYAERSFPYRGLRVKPLCCWRTRAASPVLTPPPWVLSPFLHDGEGYMPVPCHIHTRHPSICRLSWHTHLCSSLSHYPLTHLSPSLSTHSSAAVSSHVPP